jgi:membrane-associated phospholipid phosphatase
LGVASACLCLLVLPLDLSIARWFTSADMPGDLRRVFGLCEIFAHSFGVLLIVWCVWHLHPASRRRLPRVLACALAPGILVWLLKYSVVRLRPASLLADAESAGPSWIGIGNRLFGSEPLNSYLTQSFPSGHAATATGFAIGLCWLFPRGRWPLYTIATIAATQRIASAAHWPSDVFAGAALAFFVGAILTGPNPISRIFDRLESHSRGAETAPPAARARHDSAA